MAEASETLEPTALTADPEADPKPEVDAKPEGDAKPDAKPEEKADEKPEGAPEKYEAFALPDGLAATDGQLAEFGEQARELNLTQVQAQKLVDFEAKRIADQARVQEETIKAQQSQWISDLKKDPELGGADAKENIGLAVRAVQKFGGKALVELLETTGLGNHPALVRTFYLIGKGMREDDVKGTGDAAARGSERSHAEILYGSKPN